MIKRNTGIKCLFSKRVKEEASLEQILSERESGLRFKDDVYHQEFVRKELHITLPFLDQWGLLDEM